MKKVSFTAAQTSLIIDMRDEGCSYKEMSLATGITARSIKRLSAKLKLPNPQTKRTNELSAQILELFALGNNVSKIASSLSINRKAIDRVLKENGIALPSAKTTDHLANEVIALRMANTTSTDIAKLCDINATTVMSILRRNNVSKELLAPLPIKRITPTHRICMDCPEKGEQSIVNFGKIYNRSGKNKGKFSYRSRCNDCLP